MTSSARRRRSAIRIQIPRAFASAVRAMAQPSLFDRTTLRNLPRTSELPADRLDRLALYQEGPADLRNRLHDKHPERGSHDLMEASVDPFSGGSRLGSDSISMTFSATSLFLVRNSAVASSTQDDLSDPRRSVGR